MTVNVRVLFVAVFVALCACADSPIDVKSADRCIEREIFKDCMALIPVGPTHVVNNDWADVIEECRTTAYYQSLRSGRNIKPECK